MSGRRPPPGAAAVGAAVAAAAGGGGAGGAASALRSGHPLKRCLAVVDQLLQEPTGEPFRQAVSAGHRRCVCVGGCVCVRVRTRVRAYVRVCVCAQFWFIWRRHRVHTEQSRGSSQYM